MGGEGDKAGHGTKDIENYFTGSMQDCSEIFHRKIEKSGVKIPGFGTTWGEALILILHLN